MGDFEKGLMIDSIVTAVVCTAMAIGIIREVGQSWKCEAVKIGVAEYVPGKDGESVWHWKTNPTIKED